MTYKQKISKDKNILLSEPSFNEYIGNATGFDTKEIIVWVAARDMETKQFNQFKFYYKHKYYSLDKDFLTRIKYSDIF